MQHTGVMVTPAAARALLALAVLLALAGPAHSRKLHQAGSARWCVPAAAGSPAVAACTTALAAANSASVSFTCVAGGSEEGCLELISEGGADLITLGAASGAKGMLAANEQFGLEPIAAEFYGALTGANYFSVAVVPEAFCTAGVTFANLKGKRSCHTGYRRTAGWVLPMGYLVESGVIPRVTTNAAVNADAQSVAAFFSQTCAPTDDGALVAGGKWDGVCTGCKGNCTESDPYTDYEGSLLCLTEGSGDVAFTKHETALELPADVQAGLRLLCPAGGCAPLADFEKCNIAKAPAYAVMTRPDFKSGALGQAAQAALVAASANSTFLAGAKNIGGVEGLAFSEDTEGVVAVNDPFDSYFSAATKQAYEGIASLETATPTPATPTPATPTPAAPTPAGGAATASWCIPFTADATVEQACKDAVAKGNTANVTFTCVAGGSKEACMELIRGGGADMVLLGGADQLPAHEEYGLEAIAAEYYGDGLQGASYFSVAVVPAAFCEGNPTFASLKGKRSCHTGYRRTAGWMMPVGNLINSGVIPTIDSDDAVQADAESVAAFFSQTCAPGTNDAGPRLGGGAWDKMCTACKGDCSTSDPYVDYEGALLCLTEGSGDVAFTKHSTALELPAATQAGLRLLCPTGGCASLESYQTCNMARVPARAVMSRPDMQTSAKGKAVKDALTRGGETLVDAMTGIGGQEDFIFGETAVGLLSIDSNFLTFYDQSTKEAYDGITSIDQLSASMDGTPAPEALQGGGGGISDGAAAGIGIGCAVAGAVLGALGMAWWDSRRKGWKSHDKAAMGGSAAPSEAYKL